LSSERRRGECDVWGRLASLRCEAGEINRPVGSKTGRPTLGAVAGDVPRDLRPFSNDQVHQISGVFPNWAPIYYVKTPCTDHPHTKEFPTSDNWHHIVLRAFLSPKRGR
jgi:hypothetical protein